MALGLLLVVAAIVVVVRERELLHASLASLKAASLEQIALLLGSMVGGVLLTGCVFWLLTIRFGRVSFVEMQALMAATTLANYLPLRPGLVARIAWHSSRHGIGPVQSLRTVVEAMGLSALGLAALVPMLALVQWAGLPLWAALAAPCGAGLAATAFVRSKLLALAAVLRYCEMLLTALRYHVAFELIGAPVPASTSCAIACVSMIASLVPFVSNGLGLREWAIGLLAPLLAGATLAQGLSAELVHRAAELAVVVPTGLIGMALLVRAGAVTPRRDPSP
jgi:hypothetical protein